MTDREKKLYTKKANIFKALGHPTRLWITQKLAGGECCVCEFVEAMDVDFSTISKHLTVLKQAGIVMDEKRGKQIFYHLKVPCILKFMDCVDSILQTRL